MKTSTSISSLALTLLVLVGGLFGGCGFKQAKLDSEAVLTRHFQTIATNGFETANADYGSQFFKQISKEKWVTLLTKVESKLGPYKSHTIQGWRVFQNANTSGSGTTVAITCRVTYAKHTATESFTLFKGTGESDFKIVGHKISSTGLLAE